MGTTHEAHTQGNSIADVYRRAQDGFDAILATIPPDGWDTPSACEDWTVRDVVGHAVWGQELVRHLAAGHPYTSRAGAPGAEHPGMLAADQPLVTWRTARDATAAVLTEPALQMPAPARFVAHPGATLADFLDVLILDYLAHTWDVGHPLGITVRLDPDLIAHSRAATDNVVQRGPGMFAPEILPPADADQQTRWLALLGRAA